MTDRELLELAAKASGNGAVWYASLGMGIDEGGALPKLWRPLENDGDALRLAVKLRMDMGWVGDQIAANCCCEVGDPYAATRRAIVRAAAELGRTTK